MRIVVIKILFLLFTLSSTAPAAQISNWIKYAAKLANCKPSTFILPDPMQMNVSQPPSSITYKIIGLNAKGSCQVSITREVTMPGESNPKEIVLQCVFPKESLPILIQSAKHNATGNVALSTDDPASKIMSDTCKSE